MLRRSKILIAAVALALGGTAARALASDELDPLGALDEAFPRAAERAARSVVALEIERDEKADRPLTQREKMGLGLGAMRIFDQRYFRRPPGPCTGVVVAAEGERVFIVTSTWNVRDAKAVKVLLPEGGTVAAKLKGRDENLDLWLLEAPRSKGLEPATFAPQKRVGQFALLIGRGGDRDTPVVTAGVVSAVGRHKGDSIQVSARMNYGNVGGAIVDLEGRLLGIATRLTDRAYQGINSGVGFAAPADRLKEKLKELEDGKVVPRRKSPFLGIQGDLNPLPAGKTGVRIQTVVEGGAAKKAGIKDGDIIKIFNGVEMKDFMQLRDEIERLEVGDKVIVTIEREDWGEKDFTIELGARPAEEE